ncbi:hypothetical protein [Microcoleus sp. Pol10D4]|uniref:hypothetical protein n=1 Tax=Microcoleus sp. Pol10D4 TaxID=3055387 RepID=UPI002FCFC719
METELSHIKLDNGQMLRVVEEAREGSIIFVRPLGEKEVDTGKTVKFNSELEKLVLTEPVYCAILDINDEVGGKENILTWVRVVPDGRNGSTVYGRTLHPDEPDTGLAPQRRPGDTFGFRPGSLIFSIDSVDVSVVTKFEDGYAFIANTVYTWMSVRSTLNGKVLPDDIQRLLLSAARRLDASYEAFSLLHSKLKELEKIEYSIHQRNLIFETMGLVEMAIIAMNRALQMAWQIHKHYHLTTDFPNSVKNKLSTLKKIRDAYEHIEERALGLVHGQPRIEAVSIFNYERLFKEGIATYSNYELDIYKEAIDLLIDTRQYLREATSELVSN